MFITAEQLQKKINQDEIVIIDVSHKTEPFQTGKEVYENSHLPGALYLDIKEDLTGKDSFVPDPEQLAKKLGELGVSNEMEIVLYDQGTNRQVSKAYLVLTYIGHENITILQGGFNAWKEAGYNTTSDILAREQTTYKPNPNEAIVLNINDIKTRLDDDATTLIDSRANARYTGEKETRYHKAGHIPGAKNYFSRDVLQDDMWKAEEQLKKHFDSLDESEEVIVSCGSGNSACINFVALKAAGFENVKIYPGGFSEWIKDDENEVATGGE